MLLTCTLCNKNFERKQRGKGQSVFCSNSCSASYNNRLNPKLKLQGSCLICQSPCRKSASYCSRICFGVGKHGKPSRATITRSQSVVNWRVRTKQKLVEYKGGGCKICGYNKCIAALQFHHRDPSQKDFGISATTKSFDLMKLEVDKCDLLCSNCHAEEHERLRST